MKVEVKARSQSFTPIKSDNFCFFEGKFHQSTLIGSVGVWLACDSVAGVLFLKLNEKVGIDDRQIWSGLLIRVF